MGRLEELRINAYLSEVARGYSNNSFIAESLLPAQVLAVDLNEEEKFAQVIVADDQLSLAIGKLDKMLN